MGINLIEYMQLLLLALVALTFIYMFNKRNVGTTNIVNNKKNYLQYLFSFGVVFSLLYFCLSSYKMYYNIYLSETNMKFFIEGQSDYNEPIAMFMKVELIVNSLIAICLAFLAYLLIKQKAKFFALYKATTYLILGFIVTVEIVLTYMPEFNGFTALAVLKILIVSLATIILIPKMKSSTSFITSFSN